MPATLRYPGVAPGLTIACLAICPGFCGWVCPRGPGFSVADSEEVKTIETVTNHDVKAVEYFLKAKARVPWGGGA